eukprot:scaffold6299_cov109-Isochrysis_galbana.AAC.4
MGGGKDSGGCGGKGRGWRRASERRAGSRDAVVCRSNGFLGENKTLGRGGRPDHPSRHLRMGQGNTQRRQARPVQNSTTTGAGSPDACTPFWDGVSAGWWRRNSPAAANASAVTEKQKRFRGDRKTKTVFDALAGECCRGDRRVSARRVTCDGELRGGGQTSTCSLRRGLEAHRAACVIENSRARVGVGPSGDAADEGERLSRGGGEPEVRRQGRDLRRGGGGRVGAGATRGMLRGHRTRLSLGPKGASSQPGTGAPGSSLPSATTP